MLIDKGRPYNEFRQKNGHYLDVSDLESIVSNIFDVTNIKEESEDTEDGEVIVYRVKVENSTINRIYVGVLSPDGAKNKVLLSVDSKEPDEIESSDLEDMNNFLSLKEELLNELTGYTAEERRDKMK